MIFPTMGILFLCCCAERGVAWTKARRHAATIPIAIRSRASPRCAVFRDGSLGAVCCRSASRVDVGRAAVAGNGLGHPIGAFAMGLKVRIRNCFTGLLHGWGIQRIMPYKLTVAASQQTSLAALCALFLYRGKAGPSRQVTRCLIRDRNCRSRRFCRRHLYKCIECNFS